MGINRGWTGIHSQYLRGEKPVFGIICLDHVCIRSAELNSLICSSNNTRILKNEYCLRAPVIKQIHYRRLESRRFLDYGFDQNRRFAYIALPRACEPGFFAVASKKSAGPF